MLSLENPSNYFINFTGKSQLNELSSNKLITNDLISNNLTTNNLIVFQNINAKNIYKNGSLILNKDEITQIYFNKTETDNRYINENQFNSINNNMILDGTINANDVNKSQLQLRISGNCLVGEAIRKINPDGTVECSQIKNNSFSANFGTKMGSGSIVSCKAGTTGHILMQATFSFISKYANYGTDYGYIKDLSDNILASGYTADLEYASRFSGSVLPVSYLEVGIPNKIYKYKLTATPTSRLRYIDFWCFGF
jgi:hypothetical protein